MATASERGWPTVYPHLRYRDPGVAIPWLVRTFGFREVARVSRPDRFIVSELEGPDGGTVMVAPLDQEFRDFIRSRVPDAHDYDVVPFPWLSGSTSIAVADVDHHHDRAVTEGASVLEPPSDQPWGLRSYAALDLEGHQWQFAQQLGPVAPEQWGATRM